MTEATDTPVAEVIPTPTSDAQIVETPVEGTETPAEVIETQDAKTFNQDDVDRIVAKEKSIVERRALKSYSAKLEALSQKPETQVKPAATKSDKPTMAQYGEDVEGYVEAVAEYKLQERDKEIQRRHEDQQQDAIKSKADVAFAKAEENPDFDRDVFDSLPFTDPMAYAVIDSDVAPELLAHFTQNPTEAARIAKLSPARQAAEIGKIEGKLAVPTKPTAVKASKAPSPINTVGTNGGKTSKPTNEMSFEEFRNHEKERGSKYA